MAGPAFTAEDAARLETLYADSTGPKQRVIGEYYLFSDRPVTGWWRHRDKFQIIPPPDNAPVPDTILGDWPFLLQYAFDAPTRPGAGMSVRMREGTALRQLLPVLIRGPRFQPNFYSPQHHWVITRSSDLSAAMPIYAQEYYFVPGRVAGDDLSDEDPARAAKVVSAEDYYTLRGRSGDEAVEIPTSLSDLLDAYYGLAPELRSVYLRACYWFNLGRFLFPYSNSSSFVAHVVAIESLISKDSSPHACSVCGADHYPSLTGAFRRFLNKYVPESPERERFYETRSKIAHGSTLLSFDMQDEWNNFSPDAVEERQRQDELWQVAQLALVNWLASSRAADAPPLE